MRLATSVYTGPTILSTQESARRTISGETEKDRLRAWILDFVIEVGFLRQ